MSFLGHYGMATNEEEQRLQGRVNILSNLAHVYLQAGANAEAIACLNDARRLLGPTGAEIDALDEKKKLARSTRKPAKKKPTGGRL